MTENHGHASFQATHWSLVHRAVTTGEETAPRALAELCQAYWYPIYAFIRRKGYPTHDAEDLTQGFFTKLLKNDILAAADPEKGRLRTFLLACLRNYLKDQNEHKFAAKRGAALTFSLDTDWAEQRYATEPPAGDLPPDLLFQRRWATTVLEHSLQSIAAEFAAAGKDQLFQALRPFLGFGPATTESYETVAARLEMPVGTLKSHVSRLRQKWKETLFEQVAATLDDPTSDNIKAELSELLDSV